jgi:hypothetical protein
MYHPLVPETLFGTCASAGATLVAIIGGLLITRYITLESEIRGALRAQTDLDRSLEQAKASLAAAKFDFDKANIESSLVRQDVYDMLRQQDFDLRALQKRVNELDDYADQVLEPIVTRWKTEAMAAASKDDVWRDVEYNSDWDYFRSEHDLPISIEPIWHLEFDIARAAAPRPLNYACPPTSTFVWNADEIRRLAQVKDEALRKLDIVEAQKQIADEKALKHERPPGLWLGIAVLAFLTITTVVIPVLYLTPSDKPGPLGPAAIVFWFFLGISSLFLYMIAEVVRITRRPTSQ